mmetsp:Transcript_60433/g.70675  ORF Transcript_60433/g.70675 Transcript_60433/m.70675 type:complete len:692 (+) Transcript_60433:95-2170(+)
MTIISPRTASVFAPFLVSFLNLHFVESTGQRYKNGDHVDLWVNKVGPYANPQEAYEYYTLPFCEPTPNLDNAKKEIKFNEEKSDHSVGEHFGGHTLRHSGHSIIFASKTVTDKCSTKALTADEAKTFTNAASDQWFYQWYLDELPVWGMVGEMLPPQVGSEQKGEPEYDENGKMISPEKKHTHDEFKRHWNQPTNDVPYVYTDRTLSIYYNQDKIVKIDLNSSPQSLAKVAEGEQLTFTLTVEWLETKESAHGRFDRYLDHDFFKHQIHWFSIFNSFMMVLFLTGLVALIMLRTLKKDFARYSIASVNEDFDDAETGETQGLTGESGPAPQLVEDSGWKLVHGDVFRAPPHLSLLASLLGTGWQLIILTLGLILFAIAGPAHGGDVYEERGTMMGAALVLYALSSTVAGYISGNHYKIYSAPKHVSKKSQQLPSSSSGSWQSTMLFTSIFFPTVIVVIHSILNTVSLYYGTINTVPFHVVVQLLALWVFISVPLSIVGTLFGRNGKNLMGGPDSGTIARRANDFPCRVNSIPRPIPSSLDVPWYGKPLFLIPFSGLLPFGSIFIELYYVLTSLWNYKFYHVYGFMFAVYIILFIVTGMTSIISTYFCLNAGENYHWHWTSFGSGASTAFYVFLYAVYYFIFKTDMHGYLQVCYYFGYTMLICVSLGTLCGTLGYYAANKFVRTIFANVKID